MPYNYSSFLFIFCLFFLSIQSSNMQEHDFNDGYTNVTKSSFSGSLSDKKYIFQNKTQISGSAKLTDSKIN